MKDTLFDIEKINQGILNNKEALISSGEEKIESEVDRTATEIFSAGSKVKIVLVSGRSASGKTTFTKKVCKKLCEMGRNAVHIELDDFWLGFEYLPVNPDGTYNMESISGLDTALANSCFKELLEKGESNFPTFDFPNQRRGEKVNRISLGENGIIFIEGIHALNPILTENLPKEDILRVFIEPKSGYSLNGEKIFSPKDIRLLRRSTRDEFFRGWEAEKTLIQWKSVLEGEKIYIEPYIDLADIKVDSSVEFEPAIFKEKLTPMLKRVQEDSAFFTWAKEILQKLSLFEEIKCEFLPKESILHEFVG